MNPQEKFEEEKKELWKRTVIAYTQASNSISKERCIIWADYVVEEFERRFRSQTYNY